MQLAALGAGCGVRVHGAWCQTVWRGAFLFAGMGTEQAEAVVIMYFFLKNHLHAKKKVLICKVAAQGS